MHSSRAVRTQEDDRAVNGLKRAWFGISMGVVMALAVAAMALIGLSSGSVASAAGFEEFGIESFGAEESTVAAGMHPDFTTAFTFKHEDTTLLEEELSSGRLQGVSVALPPGLTGNPANFPKCSAGQFVAQECPIATQVGIVKVLLSGHAAATETLTTPLYDLEPPHRSMVARFGFIATVFDEYINIKVRTGSDYGVTATVEDSSGQAAVVSATTTLWGSPSDPSHDELRLTPFEAEIGCENACLTPSGGRSSGVPVRPFMTNPTSCSSQLVTATATNYEQPGKIFSAEALLPPTTACDALSFQPSLTVEPTSRQAGAPTGLNAVLKIPQTNSVGLPATSEMRDASVTLPEGMTIAPGAANGLEACSAAQVGLGQETQSNCPEAAKIGSATFVSPALPEAVHGAIYQRTPEAGHLFRIWLVSDEYGLHLKIPGEIEADPRTGRLTSVFSETPQLPVEEIDLQFKGGARAPLKNPDACGTYQTEYELTPWSGSAPTVGKTAMTIDEGCATGGFKPKLSAGSANPVGGAFSPFTVDVTQEAAEQNLAGLDVTLPPGLEANLTGVELCPAAQAATGACPASSQIGTTTVAAGPGSSPLWIPQPGKAPTAVYLTGPYKGAPFGLSILVPAQAGPFDLGNVVVRAAIHVDPRTAQASVTSDPLPQILEGVPISYRTVKVDISRPGFILNPTSCAPTSVGANATSAAGAVASLSDRFQVSGCAGLPFKPTFSASTQGKASKANGASLTVKVAAKPGEANIGKVNLQLPVQLPSRLTTLQKACTEAVFNANPAACPAESVIGSATAHTPILEVPLSGPAYLVSHGGAAFPDVEFVLQADERGGDFEIILDGGTQIKKGITYSNFETVPDAPISSFETVLPTGPHSIVTANLPSADNYNLCGQALKMPTKLTGQNGAVVEQTTAIAVTGCAPAIKVTKGTVKGNAVTLVVSVPSAGKLTAKGTGLTSAAKTVAAAKSVTLKLKLNKQEQKFLTRHRDRRLKLRAKLQFTPKKGSRLSSSVTVLVG
jgi:hypothetical protein